MTSSTRSGKVYRVELPPTPSDPNQSVNAQMLNSYLSKKTITQGLLDVALLTANVSQLKYVYSLGPDGPSAHPFYNLMMVLISLSIILQITTGLCLILIGKDIEGSYFRNADVINNLVTVQVFFITVLNILISSFGIEESVQRSRKFDEWETLNADYFHNCSCIEPTRLFYSSTLRSSSCA